MLILHCRPSPLIMRVLVYWALQWSGLVVDLSLFAKHYWQGENDEWAASEGFLTSSQTNSLWCGKLFPFPFLAQWRNHVRAFAAGINTRGDWQLGGFMSSLATHLNSSLAKQLNHQSLVAGKENIAILQLGNNEECTAVSKSVISV